MLESATTQRRRIPGGRSFRLLILSLALSSSGDWIYNVALLTLVYARTGSPTLVALTTAARVLPVVVLGPIGGVLVDRYDRRRLIIASDLIRALLMLALAAVAATGLPIVLAPIIAAAATAAGVVQPPAVAATTARFVSGEEIQRANALRAAVGQAAIIAGPALGAVVLMGSSASVAILLNALSFLGSALAITAIGAGPAFRPPVAPAADSLRPSVLADIRAGAQALRGAPTAVRLLAADVLGSMVYGVLTVTLVLVSRNLGAGSSGYGLLMGAFGAGGVIGAAVTARMDAPARWRRMLTIALVLVAFPVGLLGLAPTLLAALALALLGGGGMIVGEVLSETALPRLLDDEVLARAYGLAFPVSIGGIVVGSAIAGPLVSLFGVTGALAFVGLVVLAAAALLLVRPLQPAPPTELALMPSL
jgi:MFS family permease